jgi:hypothetical protein
VSLSVRWVSCRQKVLDLVFNPFCQSASFSWRVKTIYI